MRSRPTGHAPRQRQDEDVLYYDTSDDVPIPDDDVMKE
jgi:hypothetical protein